MCTKTFISNAILVLVGVFIAVTAALGASVRTMTFDDLVRRSDQVIYGRVVGTRSFWDPATRTIWTETELQVLDGPKGRTGSTVVVTEPGGIIGDTGQLFPGVPKFEVGREVVVFLHTAGNRHRVTGLAQGVYQVTTDSRTGERVAHAAVQKWEPVYEDGHTSAPRNQTNSRKPLDEFLDSIRHRTLVR